MATMHPEVRLSELKSQSLVWLCITVLVELWYNLTIAGSLVGNTPTGISPENALGLPDSYYHSHLSKH